MRTDQSFRIEHISLFRDFLPGMPRPLQLPSLSDE
jgi:hypothetical protein